MLKQIFLLRQNTKPLVFWPPAVLLLLALAASIADFDRFYAGASAINRWLLTHFDWLFSYASFGAVLLICWAMFSKIGAVRIGGPDAKPILSRWNWFAITLCTTIAIGILFWAAAEPIFHVNGPPGFAGVAANSDGASRFALSTLYMHWTITPYAIYAVPALAFALAHFNLGRPYSLSGPLTLLFGKFVSGKAGAFIDAAGLYALVAGVAASLGVGVMTIAGGLERMTPMEDSATLRLFITIFIVIFFVVSSATGITRGIKYLSDLNVRMFVLLAIFILVAGPTGAIAALGIDGLVQYITDFVPASIAFGGRAGDPWMHDWTVFYFANWLAWAPITALFLGRIAVGYTVREFIAINLLAPAAFSALWMTIFGGAAIMVDQVDGGLTTALEAGGPNAVIYALFNAFPFAAPISVIFILLTFISFVTAMDSNTHSIASVCLKASVREADQTHQTLPIKVFWGVLVGAVAWVMTATTGIDGVRMLSNLGGAPGLFILISMGAVILVMRVRHYRALVSGRD